MSLYWALPYVATGCYKFYNLIGSLKLLTNKLSEIMESIACHQTVSARETSKREERFQDQSGYTCCVSIAGAYPWYSQNTLNESQVN